MPRSRSILDETNLFVFRHPLMFTAEGVAALYPDWDGETLDQYEGTEYDVGWVFRRDYSNTDDIAKVQLQQINRIDWPDLVAQFQEDETKLLPKFLEANSVTPQTAELTVMTVRWYGPYFHVARTMKRSAKGIPIVDRPFTVEDFTGSGKKAERSKKHPLNAQLMPILPAWVDLLDPQVCDTANAVLKLLRQRRTPQQEAEFPSGSPGVDAAGGEPAGPGLRDGDDAEEEDDGA